MPLLVCKDQCPFQEKEKPGFSHHAKQMTGSVKANLANHVLENACKDAVKHMLDWGMCFMVNGGNWVSFSEVKLNENWHFDPSSADIFQEVIHFPFLDIFQDKAR